MFYGEFTHTLDAKDRLIVPAKFREAVQANFVESFFITRGLDGCLFMFTEDEWHAQEARFKALSFTHREARQFNRLFFSGAAQLTCDKQGRILLPQYLKQYASIDRDVVIVGVSNRVEIWALDRWTAFYDEHLDSFEEIAERLNEPTSS